MNNLTKDLELKDLDLKRQLEHHNRNKKEIDETQKTIKKIEDELKGKEKIKLEDIQKEIKEIRQD